MSWDRMDSVDASRTRVAGAPTSQAHASASRALPRLPPRARTTLSSSPRSVRHGPCRHRWSEANRKRPWGRGGGPARLHASIDDGALPRPHLDQRWRAPSCSHLAKWWSLAACLNNGGGLRVHKVARCGMYWLNFALSNFII